MVRATCPACRTRSGSYWSANANSVRQYCSEAQAPSGFFADGRGARLPIAGTIPIGYELPKAQAIATPVAPVAVPPSHSTLGFSDGGDYYDSGKMGANWGTGIPIEVTPALMQRGRERFGIYCEPCHSPVGDGDGMVARRGFPHPPSYHIARLRQVSDRHFYDVITNGYGIMYAYADRVTPEDRWAIVAYIRALQRS